LFHTSKPHYTDPPNVPFHPGSLVVVAAASGFKGGNGAVEPWVSWPNDGLMCIIEGWIIKY